MKWLRPPGSNRSGVTLAELLTVVIVIGILAGLSIPQLFRMIERAQRREAIDILNTILEGERAYYFTKSPTTPPSYYPSPAGSLTNGSSNDLWGHIFMDDPNDGSAPVSFSVTTIDPVVGGSPATVTATASTPRGNMQVRVQGGTVSWCGAGETVPKNMPGDDSCDSPNWWAIP